MRYTLRFAYDIFLDLAVFTTLLAGMLSVASVVMFYVYF